MNYTQRRSRLRTLLAGTICCAPASVFDPLSARVAETVGYEIAMLSGATASRAELAAPDLNVLTLTEIACQVERITRASSLSLIIDADHGYGNALNVMRTIQELEHAGAAAIIVEDSVLPRSFGQPDGAAELISVEEMTGKLRAALKARTDPELIIIGRTAGLTQSTECAVARAQAYAATGVDAIFLAELEKLEQLEAVRASVKLPLMIGSPPMSLQREDLAARGVRVMQQGHQALPAAVKALRETYMHLFKGGAPADLQSKLASSREMEHLVDAENYRKWQREYLR